MPNITLFRREFNLVLSAAVTYMNNNAYWSCLYQKIGVLSNLNEVSLV